MRNLGAGSWANESTVLGRVGVLAQSGWVEIRWLKETRRTVARCASSLYRQAYICRAFSGPQLGRIYECECSNYSKLLLLPYVPYCKTHHLASEEPETSVTFFGFFLPVNSHHKKKKAQKLAHLGKSPASNQTKTKLRASKYPSSVLGLPVCLLESYCAFDKYPRATVPTYRTVD